MELGFGKALEYSALGIAIVFALIIVLMIVVKIMSAIITGAEAARNKSVANAAAAKNGAMPDAQTAAAQGEKALAPGSVGDVKLYNVSDRDAAMIMAIVADKMQTPLNELRFLSIREVNEDEV